MGREGSRERVGERVGEGVAVKIRTDHQTRARTPMARQQMA